MRIFRNSRMKKLDQIALCDSQKDSLWLVNEFEIAKNAK